MHSRGQNSSDEDRYFCSEALPYVCEQLKEDEPRVVRIRTLQCRSKGNISEGARQLRRREPLEGSGGILPQKILKSRGLEMPVPASSKSYL